MTSTFLKILFHSQVRFSQIYLKTHLPTTRLKKGSRSIDRKFPILTTNWMLLGNYQGQEENAWCSYGMISEFGNKFCFLNLSGIPLDVPALCSLLGRNFTPQVIMLNTIYSIKVFNKWPPKVCGWTPSCSKGKWDWTTLVQLRPVSLNHLQCLPPVLKIRKGYQGQSEKK